MKEFNYTITDPQGIHARPAGVLVKEAAKYGLDPDTAIRLFAQTMKGSAQMILLLISVLRILRPR